MIFGHCLIHLGSHSLILKCWKYLNLAALFWNFSWWDFPEWAEENEIGDTCNNVYNGRVSGQNAKAATVAFSVQNVGFRK